MRARSPLIPAIVVCLGAATSCLVRTRVERALPTARTAATIEELTEKLEAFGRIRTMKSTVELRLSVVTDEQAGGGKGTAEDSDLRKVREFTEVRGFILIERPSKIRTIAELPVVKSKAFDMVSDGVEFKVHIPPKNRFLIGDAATNGRSKRRVDRVRPQHLLEAVLVDPPRESEPHRMLENVLYGDRAYQVVHLMSAGAEGKLRLSRKIWFDRGGFHIARMQAFDDEADLVTDAFYTEWGEAEGLPYPGMVFLSRPKDGYEVQLRIVKPGLNEELSDRSFELKAPKGVEIERIGDTAESPPGEADGHD